ncbi:MAG: methyltransferase domain-containing protein [Proteobacteria bacterium]|nr:methyltransferase domain-containing protein [Pseudomonadota bacterium]
MNLDPCPLCGAAAAVEVQAQQLKLAGLGTADLGFGYCASCGHIYQVRRASDDLLAAHYASFSNYTCFDPEAARKAAAGNLTKRLLTLAEARAPKGIAYEVGCATGYHLRHFREAGWEVGGCDPSPKAVAQAKEIFGIAIDCGMDRETLPGHDDLALVLFSHVLEHMVDPLAALKLAHGALRDDGVVLLEVPCATAPHLVPPGWFAFEHLHYFTQASLTALLAAAGFAPIEFRISLKAELYPVIAAVAGKSAGPVVPKSDPLAVAQSKDFLERLLAHDDALWRRTAGRLDTIGGPVYVWGAGVHTAQLFDRTPLYSRVKGIIDRDAQKRGIRMGDHTVIGPEDFFGRREDIPVVISSFAAEAQIAQSLAAAGIAERNIVRLYA